LKAALNPGRVHGVNDEDERPLSPKVLTKACNANADDEDRSKQPGRHEKQPVKSAVMSSFDNRCFEDAADEQGQSRQQAQQ